MVVMGFTKLQTASLYNPIPIPFESQVRIVPTSEFGRNAYALLTIPDEDKKVHGTSMVS